MERSIPESSILSEIASDVGFSTNGACNLIGEGLTSDLFSITADYAIDSVTFYVCGTFTDFTCSIGVILGIAEVYNYGYYSEACDYNYKVGYPVVSLPLTVAVNEVSMRIVEISEAFLLSNFALMFILFFVAYIGFWLRLELLLLSKPGVEAVGAATFLVGILPVP